MHDCCDGRGTRVNYRGRYGNEREKREKGMARNSTRRREQSRHSRVGISGQDKLLVHFLNACGRILRGRHIALYAETLMLVGDAVLEVK
jgi:hypothetical protein